MERFTQLNLPRPSLKEESANLPRQAEPEPSPQETARKINRIANKAAHRASTEYSRGKSGLFSK